MSQVTSQFEVSPLGITQSELRQFRDYKLTIKVFVSHTGVIRLLESTEVKSSSELCQNGVMLSHNSKQSKLESNCVTVC